MHCNDVECHYHLCLFGFSVTTFFGALQCTTTRRQNDPVCNTQYIHIHTYIHEAGEAKTPKLALGFVPRSSSVGAAGFSGIHQQTRQPHFTVTRVTVGVLC